jgi:hypothetical protein
MRLIMPLTALALVSSLTAATASCAEAPRPRRILLYRGTDRGPAGAVVLGPISGSDCARNGLYSPQEARALTYLRNNAAEAGADAVVRVSCNSAAVKGCVLAVTCTGEAVTLPKGASTSK